MGTENFESSQPSTFSPLRSRMFLAIWIASITSNVGSLVQSVGEKWQMAQLTPSTLLVALIEAGASLPLLVIGPAAGAIADIVDRRKWLLTTQVFMMAVAGALSLLTFLQLITPGILIAMAMLIGIGSSLSLPAFAASLPEILPVQHLSAGVALNSAGYNLSRVIGPALGGLVVGWAGVGWAFLLNAISFLAVVVVLWKWDQRSPAHDLPSEDFLGAIKAGFWYLRHNRPLQIILLRTAGYLWFGGVIFSLLPALAIHRLRLGSSYVGLLMSCIGAGAVCTTFVLHHFYRRITVNQLLGRFTLLAALSQAVLALEPHALIVALALFFAGMSWLAVFSTINTAIQLSVPSWVKARAFGAYQMVWGGTIAFAAAFWGALVERLGLPAGFALSALGMLIALLCFGWLRIEDFDQAQDLAPHTDSPDPETPFPMD